MKEQRANSTQDAGLDRAEADAERLGGGRGLPTSQEQPATDELLWMVNVGGEQTVEMSYADIESAWRAGRIDASTLVWRQTMSNWRPLRSVPVLSMGLPAQQRSPGDSMADASGPPPSRPPQLSGDPHSSDFAAAKRRRRSSMSSAPSSKPGPELASVSAAPRASTATLGSASPRSPNATPSSPSAAPFAVSASLAELTMHAMAMVDPHADDVARPSSPWALKSAPSGTAAQPGPGPSVGPAKAAADAAPIGDATFEKDFQELWAGGLDPNPAERAGPSATAGAAANDPNFEADFAELWAQGPQPTPAVASDEEQLPAAHDRTAQAPADAAAELPKTEQAPRAAARSETELDIAIVVEPPIPAGIAATGNEPSGEPGLDQPEPVYGSAALGALSGEPLLHGPAEAHRPSCADPQSPTEREASIPASEPKPKTGPSLESLRDLRQVPPREPSHLAPPPKPSQPSSPAAGAGLGHAAAAPDGGSAPAQTAAKPPVGEHARPSGIHPNVRPPPPRSAAARLATGTVQDASSLDKGEPRRPSLPSLSRPSVPAGAAHSPNAPTPALGSSMPGAPSRQSAAASDPLPVAVFERPSATLLFGDLQPGAAAKSRPPPLPVSRSNPAASPTPAVAPLESSATASPTPAAASAQSSVVPSITPSTAPSAPVSPLTSDFGEEDFAAALRRGNRWSVVRTWAEPWASLKGSGRLSRKAVIGVAAGAVFILAFVLSLAHSSNDSTESASAQEPPTLPAKAATSPATTPSPRTPSDTAPGASAAERKSDDGSSSGVLSRAMKKALSGASRTGASRQERDGLARADAKPGSDQNLKRQLDKTLDDWSSGTALPRDDVAPPRTTKPPMTAARRPQSRTPRPSSNVPPPAFGSADSTPKKTAWDPTNPGF